MNMPVPSGTAGQMLFSRYQNNQSAIGKRAVAAIGAFWTQMVDPAHFSDSWGHLEPVVSGIIDTHYQMSAADASQYYGLSRSVAGFHGPAIPDANLAQDYLRGFTATMGPGQFYHFLDDGKSAAVASNMARRALMGASMRVVMNGGRNTVTRAAAHDDVALGCERIIELRSCGYCSGLAASGGVRKAEPEFHAHDNCQCLARVVFRGQEPANAGLVSDWERVTAGKSGKAAVMAWDQYWSGRNGERERKHEVSGPEDATASPVEGAGNAPIQE